MLEDMSMSKEKLGKIPAVVLKTARVWPHSLAMPAAVCAGQKCVLL